MLKSSENQYFFILASKYDLLKFLNFNVAHLQVSEI